MMKDIYIGIIEDDTVIREGLVRSISNSVGLELFLEGGSVEDFLHKVKVRTVTKDQIDILLLDIGLPGMSGIKGIPFIKKVLPETDIIMLTAYDDVEQIFDALCAGACSYISKKSSLKTILDAIHTVARGGAFMSPSIARKISTQLQSQNVQTKQNPLMSDRQMELIEYLSQGLSYKMVADKMSISLNTVRSHIRNIYSILDVNSKIEVINLYRDGSL